MACLIMLGRAASIILYVFILLIVIALPVIVGTLLFKWSLTAMFTAALISGFIAIVLSLRLLTNNKYVVKDRSLNVTASARTTRVLLTSVIRVERVRHRVESTVQEWVRVVYRQGTRQKCVEVWPEDANLFVCDLISRCPQLTGFNQRKLPNVTLDDDADRTGLPSAVLLS